MTSQSDLPEQTLFEGGGLPPEIAAVVYNRIGRLQDTQIPFERAALDRLVALGRFDAATSVVELGCGTGALAERLLSHHLQPESHYLGIDVSTRMVNLARCRLAPWADRARLVRTDGDLPLPAPDRGADRVIAAYVLDLLPREYALRIVDDFQRLLVPGGLVCLSSLTWGQTPTSRLLTAIWHALWQRAPRLLGGCRPIELHSLFASARWDVRQDTVVQSYGFPSEILVASVRPDRGLEDSIRASTDSARSALAPRL